jgi:hypothetical protein
MENEYLVCIDNSHKNHLYESINKVELTISKQYKVIIYEYHLLSIEGKY